MAYLFILSILSLKLYATECLPGWLISTNTIKYCVARSGCESVMLIEINFREDKWQQHFCSGYRQDNYDGIGVPFFHYWCDSWMTVFGPATGDLQSDLNHWFPECGIAGQLQVDQANAVVYLSESGLLPFFLNTNPSFSDGNIVPEELEFYLNFVLPAELTENDDNLAEGADPISLSNGAYNCSVTDLVLPGRGLSIDITRTYNSKCDYNSRFGNSWDMNYNMKVRPLYSRP